MWRLIGAAAILATIAGYLLFNMATIAIGIAMINFGLMNAAAGVISLMSFHKQVKAWPSWLVAALGACGIIAIVMGLQITHLSLRDPATAVEVVYDILVFSSVGLWMLVEKPLGLPKTLVYSFDIVLHVYMALLVASRLFIHWKQGWSILTFLPVGIAVFGYWSVNISIRLSGKKPSSQRATNVAMNILAGLALIGYSSATGGKALSLNVWMYIGIIGIVLNVYFLGLSYKVFEQHGLSPLVMVLIYDGLLLIAGPAFSLIYSEHFSLIDVGITLGFLIGMISRMIYHTWFAPIHQARTRQTTPNEFVQTRNGVPTLLPPISPPRIGGTDRAPEIR